MAARLRCIGKHSQMSQQRLAASVALVTTLLIAGIFMHLHTAASGGIDGDQPKPDVLGGGALSNRSACFAFRIKPPRLLTDQRLLRILQRELGPTAFAQVVDPLSTTPEMQLWARNLTIGATNEMQKARLLYKGLTSRLILALLSWLLLRVAVCSTSSAS